MKPWQGQSECRIQGFGTNFYILVEPCFSLKVTIPKDASKPDGDAVENGALLSASELHARGHFVNSPSETELGQCEEDTYLSDICSVNLRQICVFPIPPIPQRRQERLDINPPLARGTKSFPRLSSTSFRPVKNGLEFGF